MLQGFLNTGKPAEIILKFLNQFTNFSSQNDRDDVLIGSIVVREQCLADEQSGDYGAASGIGGKCGSVDKVAGPLLDTVSQEKPAPAESDSEYADTE